MSGPETISAFAVSPGFDDSLVATASYSAAQVTTPKFTPGSGPITNKTLVTIGDGTLGSKVYYTLDGTTPRTSSPVYSEPFTIDGGPTVSAFGVADGYVDSAVRSVFYQLVQTATPVFSHASGPLDYGSSVSITCDTPSATIYYTLDGTPPTTNAPVYSTPITITNDITLSAFAAASDHLDSAKKNSAYTLVRVAKPVFIPGQGPLTKGALISMSCTISNAIIHYTTDGSAPVESSPIFSAPIPFAGPYTLQARAYAPQFDPSDTVIVSFGLQDYRPTVVTTVAGSLPSGYSNALAAVARFSNPQGICRDTSGNLYVADTGNNSIRRISTAGTVETLAGTGTAGSKSLSEKS